MKKRGRSIPDSCASKHAVKLGAGIRKMGPKFALLRVWWFEAEAQVSERIVYLASLNAIKKNSYYKLRLHTQGQACTPQGAMGIHHRR